MRITKTNIASLIILTAACLACRQGGSEPEPAAVTEGVAAGGVAEEGVAAVEAPDPGPRLADHEPAQLLEDLAGMREAGALRVLVHREDLKGMHRPGAAGEEEITLVSMFADSLDLAVRFVVVPTRDRLNPALLEGRGVKKDRDVWLQNVDQAIVLLEDPEYHQKARYGYCRGSEPQTYVRNIQSFYDAYSAWVPAEGIGR